MDDPSNVQSESKTASPRQEMVGRFVTPKKRTEESLLLKVPCGLQASASVASLSDKTKQKDQTLTKKNEEQGLTYKQQLKQDAMLWAEFLYSEYKRERVLLEEAKTMPTHYDNPAA